MFNLVLWCYTNLVAFINKLLRVRISTWRVLVFLLPLGFIIYLISSAVNFILLKNPLCPILNFGLLFSAIYFIFCIFLYILNIRRSNSDLMKSFPFSKSELAFYIFIIKYLQCLGFGLVIIIGARKIVFYNVLSLFYTFANLLLVPLVTYLVLLPFNKFFVKQKKVVKETEITINGENYKVQSIERALRKNEKRQLRFFHSRLIDGCLWQFMVLVLLFNLLVKYVLNNGIIVIPNYVFLLLYLGIMLGSSYTLFFAGEDHFLLYYRTLPISFTKVFWQKSKSSHLCCLIFSIFLTLVFWLANLPLTLILGGGILLILSVFCINLILCLVSLLLFKYGGVAKKSEGIYLKILQYLAAILLIGFGIVIFNTARYIYIIWLMILLIFILDLLLWFILKRYWRTFAHN